jgi:hypothetical protein
VSVSFRPNDDVLHGDNVSPCEFRDNEDGIPDEWSIATKEIYTVLLERDEYFVLLNTSGTHRHRY